MSEPLVLLLMVGAFAALALCARLPLGVALALAAVAGALAGGQGLALRHLVEGAFGFFDIILILASAEAGPACFSRPCSFSCSRA
jgi:GntP family gluconate:H+ symporter